MRADCAQPESSSAYETGQSEEAGALRPEGLELTARAIALCRLARRTRVLDLGCGSGASAVYMHRRFGLDVVGVDISASTFERATEQSLPVRFVQASANSLPIASESMDAVFAECSLSLMDAREEVLAECFRVLVADGRLVITDMFARNPHALAGLRALPSACVSGMISCAELDAQLTAQGFLVELWEDHSDSLKQLLFRFLMKGGDVDQFWNRKCITKDESGRIRKAMKEVRPGYFLLIARKRPQSEKFDGSEYGRQVISHV